MDNSIKGFMTVLSSDELRGRLTGTEENELATAYIAYKFEKFGMEPFMGESFFHEYKQKTVRTINQVHTLKVEFINGVKKEYIYGEDFSVRINVENLNLTAPITFNMKDTALKEKIAVTDDLKRDNTAARTSKCILLKANSLINTPPKVDSVNSPVPMIGISEKLFLELKSNSVKNVSINLKYPVEEITARNVVGKIPGKDHNKVLVLSAHMDGIGYAGKNIMNGAVDNASGTAVIMDLAQRLAAKAKEKAFDMDIIICAFNGEEYFLLGSEAFVKDIWDQYKEINNINIDCVGKKDGGKLAFSGGDVFNSPITNDMKKFLEKQDLEYSTDDYGLSDHISFENQGLCAITIGQGNLTSGNAIHSAKDKIENIDFEMLGKVSNAVFDFILSLNGRMYKTGFSASDMDPGQEFYDKYRKACMEERAKLGYDEYKYIKIDDIACKITGTRSLNSIEEVNKYYPGIGIYPNIIDYGFMSTFIQNPNLYSSYTIGSTPDNIEFDKVCKLPLLMQDLTCISLNYKKDQDVVSIDIYNSKEENKFTIQYLLDQYDMEKVTINNNQYSFIKPKDSGTVDGVYIKLNLKDKSYDIFVKKGKSIEGQYGDRKLPTIQYETSKEEITNIVKNMNIEDIVTKLGL
jgi:hypothetical protein